MKKIGIILSICAIFLLTACGGSKIEGALNYEVEPFTFTNQDGNAFSLEDLKGKVWVADFIFTNCETVCPPMTAHMTQLQKKAEEAGVDVEFVSFSVDPEVDTPEKLKDFASNYDLSFDNWHFLTGYSQKEIEDFAMSSFKTIVQKPKNNDQVIHGTTFFLVDQEGMVLKYYSGIENTPYDEIIQDIKTIQ
ncbi:SCO family protein [Bacillus sp. FJAT-47783]|uniref:SCO family protein n=1 Tax=Bacillus sp. FJAT-47783 TaxID=2922712 RepID=UPI001FAE3175|nr:SCO family protein [Bacillus sp. FJAT-47783]